MTTVRRWLVAVCVTGGIARPVEARAALTLADALRTAREHQPQLVQARAGTDAALAQALQARSGLLPQLGLIGSYQRTTANFVARPGVVPQAAQDTTPTANFDTFDFYNFGLTANQLIYDFGQTSGRWRAAQAAAGGAAETEQATLISILQGVRTNFFAACATKALVQVSVQTLDNQVRHLKQIEGFVEVGTRPEIDLAQGRTDVANAKVSLISAQNQFSIAKAQLNQAMGVEGKLDYDVEVESPPPVEGEDSPSEVLFEEATAARPDLAALAEQRRSQELTLGAIRGAYGPSIGVTTGMTDAGRDIGDLGWNWSAGVTVTWPLYQGGLTDAQASEARANLISVDAQIAQLRQSILVQVQQARLTVIASREALTAADEALVNARQRLRLAEGRYETGVGSVIELGDAQVALTNAAAQRVQAEFTLATARANLTQALGRE